MGIADALVGEGINVCISARKRSEIDQTVDALAGLEKGRVSGIVCDVRDHSQVKVLIERAVAEFGGLDILVNNAGVGIFSTVEVSYIMPGSVNTEFGGDEPGEDKSWQLQPADIARVVLDLLHHDDRSLPSRVEIRPSRPPKK